ncbi:hypothetical protein LEP1GSC193_3113 [Leptospira alstonii serovar Pingchang str. 80-412]|uniref:Uncharacterized protein n=2 Tax=Leptospira alstonii TaxID=28452 RepID=M6D1E0_9LEPT|nr:hypothetical protein LEP1GSC194_2716 [Leptospira alstonii serovar Sichuan str. 79601]EQA78935.1 hypothetical protein LEP1GSC193_3113 [Leptospira alstonii serovar Pingchang str. 80-412]
MKSWGSKPNDFGSRLNSQWKIVKRERVNVFNKIRKNIL